MILKKKVEIYIKYLKTVSHSSSLRISDVIANVQERLAVLVSSVYSAQLGNLYSFECVAGEGGEERVMLH